MNMNPPLTPAHAEPSAPASPPVLETRQLVRRYGRGTSTFTALDGVDIKVFRAESLAIVGKSGSGKSTLMHLLALLDRPTSGSVLLDGEDASSLRGKRLNQLRNREFGFVFQQFFLMPQSTVLENVALPLAIRGVGAAERRRRSEEALERVELTQFAKHRAVDLSGGQKQRTVIARALVAEPAVVFADEPTGNLDSATGTLVEDMLFSLNRDGITLVLVTHDPDLAAKCQRRVHVRDGLIVDEEAAA